MRLSVRLGLVVILVFSMLLAACTKEQTNTPSAPSTQAEQNNTGGSDGKTASKLQLQDFFPTQVGYTWQYHGEGNEYASFERKVVYASGDLAQFREDNGGTVSVSVYKASPEAITRIFFKGEAYSDENYLNSAPNESNVILKAPLAVGTKWNGPDAAKEIVDINASVETPAGKFTGCVLVKASYRDSTVYEYYKEGIGLIKREFVSGDATVTSSLKKFGLL